YVVMMLGMVGMYASRRHREGFITQGFVLTSLFWFPLIYLTACVFIHLGSGPAVLKTVINSWFGGNLIYLVLGSMALGASHYFVSKTTGRPLHSQQLAQIGFWSFLIFGSWTGVSRYMGGPIPAWMPTLSSVAATLLVIPAVMILVNLLKTAGDRLGWASYSPSLRFTLFGMGAFVVTVVMGAFLSRFSTGAELQFSHAWPAYELLAIYGFFSMTMFGAVYFIVPRLVGCEWPSGSLVRFHFWFSAYGTIGMVAFLFFAGMAQGHLQNIWSENFLVSVERSRPYFASLAIGWTLITLSNLAFFFQLSLMFIRRGRRVGEGPTLIHKRPEDYFNDPLVGSDEAAKA
ncbi:MAG: cbb3-type cytochrome c oxidase subunit I, partial [Verrucomicrobiota bacterium]